MSVEASSEFTASAAPCPPSGQHSSRSKRTRSSGGCSPSARSIAHRQTDTTKPPNADLTAPCSEPAQRSPDSVLHDLSGAASIEPLELPAADERAAPASSADGGHGRAPTEAERASLECTVCYSWLQPPFKRCSNEHPICAACRPSFESEECPICRVSIEAGALRDDEPAAALAAQISLPCANGCNSAVPYLSLREHEVRSCRLAPLLCPFREAVQLGPAGWSTGGRCDCRGLDLGDADGPPAGGGRGGEAPSPRPEARL